MRARWSAAALAMLLCSNWPARAAAPEQVEALYLDAMRLLNEDRQEEANAVFEQLIALEPHHAGAWLELAINHCALGHPAEAERLFRDIEVRFAPSAGILDIINSHRRRGCQPWQARSQRAFTMTAGSDSNVNQGASNPVFVTGSGAERIESYLTDDFLPKRDSYLQSTLDWTRELSQRGTVAFAQLRVRRHRSVTEQDTNALLLGLDRPFRLGHWSGHTMASTSLISLDGKLYQRQLQLQARLLPPLKLQRDTELALSAALGRVVYVSRRNFDADTGELAAQLNYRTSANQAQAAAGALLEHGGGARLGGDRHGWYASVQWQHQFSERTGAELGWSRQDWLASTVFAPGLIDVVRDQSTRQWRAALVRALAPQHSVVLELRQIHNRENITLFQYNSQVLQLSWRWTGF